MIETCGTLRARHAAVLASHHSSVDEADYERVAPRISAIAEMAAVENRAIALYDLADRKFILKTDRHLELLGYSEAGEVDVDDAEYYHGMIHGADLPYLYDSEIRTYAFLKGIEGEGKKDYKLVYDYRVRGATGKFLRILHQLCVFELDRTGSSWILLILSDVISAHPDASLPSRFVLDVKTGRVCLFNDELGIRGEMLTKREKQVVGLVSQGFDSREIAAKLCISVNTVNNHRQNVLEKTRTKNLAQAVAYTKIIGLI